MALTILYFASIREAIGQGSETWAVPDQVQTLADLAVFLSEQSPAHTNAFSDMARVRAAVDQKMADLSTSIAGAREIAFFPPVTGGDWGK